MLFRNRPIWKILKEKTHTACIISTANLYFPLREETDICLFSESHFIFEILVILRIIEIFLFSFRTII